MSQLHDFSRIFQWHQSGDLEQALPAYLEFLRRHPQHVEANVALATLYLQSGQCLASAERFEFALMLMPEHVLALHNYAKCLQKLGRLEDALRQLNRCIALMPTYEIAYVSKARLLMAMKADQAHLVFLRDAMQAFPRSAELCLQMALHQRRFHHADSNAKALVAIDQALSLRPDAASLHNTRGNILADLGRLPEAIAAYLCAIKLQANYVKAASNLGLAYFKSGDYPAAIEAYQRALTLDPNLPGLRNNYASALQNQHRFTEALQMYHEILERDPRDEIARANQGMLYLLLGRFQEGWAAYASRWKQVDLSNHPEMMAFPEWTGEESLRGKTIVLHPEQGLGDTIQFSRYAQLLAQQAEQVVLCVVPPMLALMQHSVAQWEGCDNLTVVAAGASIPAFHFQIPLLNLPRAMATSLASIPDPGAYVFAEPRTLAAWRERLAITHKKRIGLVWSGSAAHSNDQQRSIALNELMQALAQLDVGSYEFHSLQKEIREADLDGLQRFSIIDHRAQLRDFSDTAALVELMDVVVSVDTSVAHLAAAMGKTTWIMLAYVPDFRWLLEREDSPWYRSVRLFRQAQAAHWDSALSKLTAALSAQFSSVANAASALAAQTAAITPSTPSRMSEANALCQAGHWQEAQEIYRQICAAQGSSAILHNNWGVVLQKLRRFPGALEAFDLAIRLDPHYVSPHINKSMCLLSLGQFEEGWRLYEWRWQNAQWASSRRHFPQPLWLGAEDIAGKRLLVYAEQGLGDTLQFCRYLFLLREAGVHVTFEVPASLITLLSCLPVTLRTPEQEKTQPLSDVDYQCPLLSLPLALKTRVESIPMPGGYVQVAADKQAQWRDRLPRSGKLRVGVVWAGAPAHQNDAKRSIGLNLFLQLMQADLDYYVLQKRLSKQERTHIAVMRSFGKSLHVLADQLEDFADTAAVIMELDLLIAVDTSVAHLAGALGKPVWILLPYEADFRWMHERRDTPWYASARLFRQTQPGDWAAVLREVDVALKARMRLHVN